MPEQASEHRYWIGCVDDDQPFLDSVGRLVHRTLEGERCEVHCEVELASGATQFAQVDQEMRTEGYDLALLITDQMMPSCTGLELIERVKNGHPDTSCVLLTGYAGLESARYAINHRLLDRYVCKPIEDLDQFSELVLGEVERHHLRRVEADQACEIVRRTRELHDANIRLEGMKRTAERVAYFSRELRTLDLDEVLNLVCEKAPSLFEAQACFLFVPDHNNQLALWRQRRLGCLAPVPPLLDIHRAMREAMTSHKAVVRLQRGPCAGAVDGSNDGCGVVVMPLRLSPHEPPGGRLTASPPALLCLCGIQNPTGLTEEELQYKVLLINDILGANIANALAFSETERLATEDSLTGAKVRRVFDERLQAEWNRSRRYGAPFCVALMDVDHLKEINDSFGHAAGDEALQQIATIARRQSRRCDTIARFGGDEFCLLLPETDLEGAAIVVERIRQAVAEATMTLINPKNANEDRRHASVSIGVASSAGRDSAEHLLKASDKALYRAKRAGRGRISLAPPAQAEDPPE